MKEVNYKQGRTKVWSDGDKIVVRNPSDKRHCLQNVDQIFGVGQWKRILDVAYTVVDEKYNYEVISPYIPDRVLKDLEIEEDESLIGKYFK